METQSGVGLGSQAPVTWLSAGDGGRGGSVADVQACVTTSTTKQPQYAVSVHTDAASTTTTLRALTADLHSVIPVTTSPTHLHSTRHCTVTQTTNKHQAPGPKFLSSMTASNIQWATSLFDLTSLADLT